MNPQLPAFVRTYVPLAVSWLAGWLISLGVDLSPNDQYAIATGLGALVAALYYAAVRWLEKRYPTVGALLGYIRQPVYVDPTKTLVEQEQKVVEAADVVAKTPEPPVYT